MALFALVVLAAGCEGGSRTAQYSEGSVECSEVSEQASASRPDMEKSSFVALKGGGGGGGSSAGASAAGARGGGGGVSSASGARAGSGSGVSGPKPAPPSRVSPSSSSTSGYYGASPVLFFGDGDDGDEDGFCMIQYEEEGS